MKKAFTLAETLITLSVLGIVAAIAIPQVIQNRTEVINRDKVKKAMAVYERVLQSMIYGNSISSNGELQKWADGPENNCENTSSYFKIVDGEGCIFKTSDGIWWNIRDIQKALIYTKNDANAAGKMRYDIPSQALKMDNKYAFYMIGRFDEIGTLRINDLGYEIEHPEDDSDLIVEKLINYAANKDLKTDVIAGKSKTQIFLEECESAFCKIDNLEDLIPSEVLEAIAEGNFDTDCTKWADADKRSCTSCKGNTCYYYNDDGQNVMWITNDGKQRCLSGPSECDVTNIVNPKAKNTQKNKNIILETHYKTDENGNQVFDYYFARIMDEDGYKIQAKYGCNKQNICQKVEFLESSEGAQLGDSDFEVKVCTIEYNRETGAETKRYGSKCSDY